MNKLVFLPWAVIMKSLELLGNQVDLEKKTWTELDGELKEERDKLLGEFYDHEE